MNLSIFLSRSIKWERFISVLPKYCLAWENRKSISVPSSRSTFHLEYL